MGKIALVDVDGHNFPNLALMRISAFHKKQGDKVEWWDGMTHYDIAYKSKIFSNAYTKDILQVIDADVIHEGGTGYAIHKENGREVYEKEKDKTLSEEIETMFPDYSIYPQYDFAVAMTSRGCPRGCPFCIVKSKEGNSHKVANVEDFYSGQNHIKVLDPNILACAEADELLEQYKETNAMITFSQGLDIRLINGNTIEMLNSMRIKTLHFAWDNPKQNIEEKFKEFAKGFKRNSNIGTVYILTNYNSTMEENLYRIYTLRELGYKPYVMIYDKPSASKEIKKLQQWCNNKRIFNKCGRFEDYNG